MKESRRFTSDEVTSIVRRALEHRGLHDTVDYDDLLDIARSSGISAESLNAAIEEQETVGELEDAKAIWMERRRAKFYAHLRSYLIVNGVLFLINVVTSRSYLWAVWPMLGWGIGLAFDASDTFFVVEAKKDRGARKIIRARRRRLGLD